MTDVFKPREPVIEFNIKICENGNGILKNHTIEVFAVNKNKPPLRSLHHIGYLNNDFLPAWYEIGELYFNKLIKPKGAPMPLIMTRAEDVVTPEQWEKRKKQRPGKEIKIGDYVLATRYPDGDPQDPWALGFVQTHNHLGVYITDGDGKLITRGAYQRYDKISAERGKLLLDNKHIVERGSRSLWWYYRTKISTLEELFKSVGGK